MGGPCASLAESSGTGVKRPRCGVTGGGMACWPWSGSPELALASNLVPLLCWATLGTSVPPGKGPLRGLNGSIGSSGAGSPLLRPVPLLPFSNTSCGFLT